MTSAALVITGLLIIAALAGYAVWLHYCLWRQRRQSPGTGSEPLGGDPGRVELRKSIYLIADAMLDDKMTHTEACLRIAALANNLQDSEHFRREYGVLFRVAEATAHFPILDAWRALGREDQVRLTRERQAIEQKYGTAVVDAVERLKVALAGSL